MITIVRDSGKYRKGHFLGNRMITLSAKLLFGKQCNDILSGYRVFSKRFAKSFPANSRGFEIETELTIYALQMRLPISEMKAEYKSRMEGTHSKVNTFKDGLKILTLIIYLLMTERPLLFWWIFSLIFAFFGFYYGINIIIGYIQTSFVPIATSVLTICFILLSGIFIITGLIMNAINKVISQSRRYQYNNN